MLLTEYRLDLVIQALRSILPLEHPADAVLRHFFQRERIGSNERALVAETVFGVLRHRLFLEHACVNQATPRRMALAYWIKFSGYNLRELTPLLKRDEADWLGQVKAITLAELSLSVQAELPEWLVEQLQITMTDEAILMLGRSMQQPAALDLRVNTLLATRDEVLQALQADGMDAQATPYSPIGIRLKDKPSLTKHPLFLGGKIEVQDEGSQLLGFLLAPKRNDMVVDFCAGAGGKALMLGAMMQSQGRLYALDVSEKRLANLKPRLKRSGLSNLHPQLIAHENDSKIKRLAGKIDRVLVDAPCSGLGTLRRNPDIKFRQSSQSVTEFTQLQTSILASASKLLKPGGRLVYTTCSFLPQENRAIVDAFLADHPEFTLRPAGEILAQQKIPLEAEECLQLLPQLHSTDAFFAAVLERVKAVAPNNVDPA
ncbi:RsmB/NOP family class I SAM-dependent RNA methyltransferase [Candidatus Nitrotoga sp. AM1P]|uniref:RsmB/NOP family class I SAM-dependent RNA methyltransferase n=1 Tax=Candidatus Nitrotoga sp. AM1P TaxID=2559597 RepID=UPI0010B50871|nr:RsmB/NOP family class I SAM-dependent RNA methyltransferase [Candidatus Nitrotoga sp. AM1P]BBJ23585.1 SAM-dependent methyltransferase [Candidatus Nitrotoga sp. AM1P]